MLLPNLHTGPPVLATALPESSAIPPSHPFVGGWEARGAQGLVLCETKPEKLIYAKSMQLPSTDLEHVLGCSEALWVPSKFLVEF